MCDQLYLSSVDIPVPFLDTNWEGAVFTIVVDKANEECSIMLFVSAIVHATPVTRKNNKETKKMKK